MRNGLRRGSPKSRRTCSKRGSASRLSKTLRLFLPPCAWRVLNFASFLGFHILVRGSAGGVMRPTRMGLPAPAGARTVPV